MKVNFVLKLLLLAVGFFVASCSNSASDGPGQCQLQCGGAVIADSNYTYEPLFNLEQVCALASASQSFTTKLVFRILKQDRLNGEGLVPAPHISVELLAVGNATVLTNKDDWCSDACGTVRVSVRSTCPGPGKEQPGTLILVSGAMVGEPANLRISTEDAEEEEGGG